MAAATPVSRFAAGSLTWYSVLIALSVLLSYVMVIREEKRRLLPANIAADAFIYFVPTGIIGARIYYVVFSLSQFASNPIRALFIWEGGLAIYGAIIGGIAGVYLYARRKRLSLALLMDVYAPFLALSQAIGRWGNYFNQEAYGYSVSNPRLMFFPAAVLIATGDSPQWHYATFFYESIWNLFVFFILLRTKRKPLRTGDLFLIYLMLYGLGRTICEAMRSDSLMILRDTIRVSQLVGAVTFSVIAIYFVIRSCRELRGYDRRHMP